MTGPTHRPDPFDPEVALTALRSRLAEARARRRRAVASSALSVSLVVGVLGLVTLPTETDPDEVAVVASAHDTADRAPTTSTSAASVVTTPSTASPTSTTTIPVDPPPPQPEPPAPVTAPVVTPPPPPPPPPAPDPGVEQLTVSYDGAGSMVVEKRGDSLTLVSSTPAPGWTATPHIGSDYVKVEFTKDGVHRFLKVKVHDGQVKVERWEHTDAPSCTPPVGTTVHDAPRGAGRITVTVTPEGKLTLDQVTASAGWKGNIEIENHDTAKVKFRQDGSSEHAWVKVMLRDCTIEVETGSS